MNESLNRRILGASLLAIFAAVMFPIEFYQDGFKYGSLIYITLFPLLSVLWLCGLRVVYIASVLLLMLSTGSTGVWVAMKTYMFGSATTLDISVFIFHVVVAMSLIVIVLSRRHGLLRSQEKIAE